MTSYENPIVLQRADPWILRVGSSYYFTASHPEYDRIAIRRSSTINGLQAAQEISVWQKHASGAMSKYIWAPELHRIHGIWYIYFAAAEKDFEASGLPTHRMYVLENQAADPLSLCWEEKGRICTPLDSFSLDATTFIHQGVQYLIWAQKDPAIAGNSNLYIATMKNPWTLDSAPVMLSKPEYDWECVDYKVNEGPAVIIHDGVVYVTYSASGTGIPYAVGMLSAPVNGDLLDTTIWTKRSSPVFRTFAPNGQYGPGHNSFTRSSDGKNDLIVYHARNYTNVVGDPLFDPNRHARVGVISWLPDGPDFGVPEPDTRWTPTDTEVLPPDGGLKGGTAALQTFSMKQI